MEEPRRIVSLVPSDTYTLVRLGLGGRLVGRTVYCVEPASSVAAIETVGGTKNADVARIVALRPDLVIANQEENRRRDIEELERLYDRLFELDEALELHSRVRELEVAEARGEAKWYTHEEIVAFQQELIAKSQEAVRRRAAAPASTPAAVAGVE